MSATDCFQSGSVVPDLQSTEKYEAIRELIRRAPVLRVLGDAARFEEAVIERERQQSTGFGHGVAVAHGRVEGVPRVLIALGISREGIPFDSPDGEPVRLLFTIASPPSLSLEYLQVLSTLVRCLREKEDREGLIHAPSAGDIEHRIRAAFSAGLERFAEPLPRLHRLSSVLLVPAIDLRAGRCVRLLQGRFTDLTSYSRDPVETARAYEEDGARWIHIVDLDAAEGRGADNRGVIRRIRQAVSCRLQAGGGVRTRDQAISLIEAGVDRLVVGTAIVKSPDEVRRWAAELGPRFAAGVDARDGRVKISGWTEEAARADTDVAAGLRSLGMRWLIYTNISRDGTLAGPDVPRTNSVARAAGLPTLVSGGIGGTEDVEAVARCAGPLVCGVILGKALYEGRVSLKELIRRFPQTAGAWDD